LDDDNHKKYYQTARDLYEKAAKVAANNSFVKVQAQLNLLSLLVDPQIGLAVDLKKSKELRLEILSQLSKLPPSHKIVYAKVSLMNSLVHLNSEQLKNANNVSNLSSVTHKNYQTTVCEIIQLWLKVSLKIWSLCLGEKLSNWEQKLSSWLGIWVI
jgi:hypothetical protein